jgi:hypothetical protein
VQCKQRLSAPCDSSPARVVRSAEQTLSWPTDIELRDPQSLDSVDFRGKQASALFFRLQASQARWTRRFRAGSPSSEDMGLQRLMDAGERETVTRLARVLQAPRTPESHPGLTFALLSGIPAPPPAVPRRLHATYASVASLTKRAASHAACRLALL